MLSSQKGSLRVCKKTKGKDFVKSQTDRFDELPDDILSSIVSYFNVRDAANASLLSSRWRHVCASMSDLNFTSKSMFRTNIDYDSGSNGDDCDDNSRHPCPEFKDRFVRGVNQFLQYYKEVSRLFAFRVGFCLDRDSTSDIDQWVSSCILEPGVIDYFGSLKHLTLGNIHVGQEEIESIGSCCLNLESFRLGSCEVSPKLCISGSFQRLKFLVVHMCRGLEEIELSSTSVTSFEYAGLLIKFYFSRAANLEKVYFNTCDEKGMLYIVSQLAKDFPLVKTLSVHTETKWVKRLPKEMATFNNIRQLELFCHQATTLQIQRLIVGLRACPLFEKLYLAVKCRVHFEQRMQVSTEFVNKHLKEVHIGGFYYCKSFIQFALYLLKYATGLEKMVIDRQPSFYNGIRRWYYYNCPWDEGEYQKICKRLQGQFKSDVIVLP